MGAEGLTFTRALVGKLVSRDFSPGHVDAVLDILDRYGVEPHETERERVHVAVLKLSAGRIDQVERNVSAAKADFRDVLLSAESPKETALAFGIHHGDERARVEAESADAKQFKDWLKGRSPDQNPSSRTSNPG